MTAGLSPTDRRDRPSAAALRAAIAVLALYAFVLQAFLGGLMPLPAAAEGLCAQHAASDAAPDKALPHGHGACCTAAQATTTALPGRAASAVIVWRTAAASRPAWAMTDGPRARAPPGGIASPRGPPAA
ncbi:hypothetical protein [Methylobacterium sp. PvR107]|uniref:hypothetical protein n=1 Tax=Methylobacterium sp. PvR107 TaxID=2806597 RepID=UPI001AEB8A27|nr:hypothetical protein [Methylobacterium sp. PvR107]MBP1182346.1 hypothetical protein [Methylobacterium sp. PvR107]